jgi:hypothetical protein
MEKENLTKMKILYIYILIVIFLAVIVTRNMGLMAKEIVKI